MKSRVLGLVLPDVLSTPSRMPIMPCMPWSSSVLSGSSMPLAATAAENRNGKFVWSSRRMTGVRIGGGGPELQFETLNGDVMVRNREK